MGKLNHIVDQIENFNQSVDDFSNVFEEVMEDMRTLGEDLKKIAKGEDEEIDKQFKQYRDEKRAKLMHVPTSYDKYTTVYNTTCWLDKDTAYNVFDLQKAIVEIIRKGYDLKVFAVDDDGCETEAIRFELGEKTMDMTGGL